MAVGLKAAGYDIIFANDFDKRAVRAYAHNIGDHVVCGDITSELIQAQIPYADVMGGGPPCQDYSVAGDGEGEEGERGKLVWAYFGRVEEKQPMAFVFENVKGLISKKHRPTFDALLAKFDEIGYNVSWRLINAWDFGVAQKRERVFIVGIRKDLGFTFEFPEPTEDEYRTQVIRDAIGDLPDPGTAANHQKEKFPQYVQNILDGKSKTNFGKMPFADVASPARTVLDTYGDKKPTEILEVSNHSGALFDNVGCNPTWEHANREADVEQPAPTRTEKDRCDGINPINGKPRRFTVRECLRLQSVPDWYVLPDDISLSAQYRIVGNGVASRVSYKIGVALAEQLNAALAREERRAA